MYKHYNPIRMKNFGDIAIADPIILPKSGLRMYNGKICENNHQAIMGGAVWNILSEKLCNLRTILRLAK